MSEIKTGFSPDFPAVLPYSDSAVFISDFWLFVYFRLLGSFYHRPEGPAAQRTRQKYFFVTIPEYISFIFRAPSAPGGCFVFGAGHSGVISDAIPHFLSTS